MSIQKRIKNVEQQQRKNKSAWVQSLSDDELERLIESHGGRNPLFTGWLQTLTDDEVLTIRDGNPGAKRLMEKFNEYQRQNKKA